MTKYYIDYTNGDDSNTGTSPDSPWKTINKFTNEARSPGDVGVLKWNTTWVQDTSNIYFLSDGSFGNPITLRGWDPDEDNDDTSNSWQSAYDTGNKPIIDFNESAYYFALSGDFYWHFKDFDVKNSGNTAGAQIGTGVQSADCLFENINSYHTGTTKARNALSIGYQCNVQAINCEFGTNGGMARDSVNINRGYTKFINCKFDNAPTSYSGMLISHAVVELYGCSFNNNVTRDLNLLYFVDLKAKDCGLDISTINFSNPMSKYTKLGFEDYNGTTGNHKVLMPHGEIEKDTTIKTGNADSSMRVTPNSYVNDVTYIEVFEWKITDVTAAQHTVTVAVRGSGWASFPTADELYIEVEYYDQTTGTHTTTAKSTQVLTANDTWTDFSVTFTPAQAGDIYVRGYLKKYEDGDEVVWFNGEVSIT